MGFGKKSYDEQLDEELKDKFGEKDRGGKGHGEVSAEALEKPSRKKKVSGTPVFPQPVYGSPWSARLKILGMFMILWFLVFGIAIIVLMQMKLDPWNIQFFVIIAGVMILFNVIIYYMSDRMVLRSYNAKIIAEKDNPRLYNIIKDISLKADLPMPRVAIIPMATPNAFATGRNPSNAVVAATEGLMDLLDDDEIAGVMAHEMAHVKNRDILVMTVASTAAMIIAFFARIMFFQMFFGRSRNVSLPLLLIAGITAPIAAFMVQFAISRSREYKADRIGAIIIKKPLALADALAKLEKGVKMMPMKKGDPSTSSLFIVNPFRRGAFASLFSTHPPMKERISRLRKMAETYSYL